LNCPSRYTGELIDYSTEAAKRGELCDSNKVSYLFDLDWEYNNLSGAADVHSEFKPTRDDIPTVDAFRLFCQI
jgi:hypothetical protein